MPTLEPPLIEGLQTNQPLARYTAARLGGPADCLYIAKNPDYGDALALLRWAWRQGMDTTVIGGGANVLVSDAGIRGLTIINRATAISLEDDDDEAIVSACSGTSLIRLARFCQERGLTGMEWAIAVPGTVGGAVVNNAGAHGGDIAGALTGALVIEAAGGECWLGIDDMDYAYRHSSLKRRADRRFFVTRARFRLGRDDPQRIQERMDDYNEYRRRTQPAGASLGSIFKNPPGDYAGRLIEAAGVKGRRAGSVEVSRIHGNFFVNTSAEASARDYFKLINMARDRVLEAFGVLLELEIQTLGEWE